MPENNLRQDILRVCQRLYQRNLLAAADGNVSVKISSERILITPSGVSKAHMPMDQIAVMDIEGHILEGQPSSERLMHLRIYQECPEARAVVHAHPPHAIAWSLAHPELSELPGEYLSEVILAAGSIPIVPYARPGTEQMGDHLKPYLPRHRALVLARHGAVCWGESLDEALHGMERVEHSAQILHLAFTLGKPEPLAVAELEALRALRAQIGDRLL